MHMLLCFSSIGDKKQGYVKRLLEEGKRVNHLEHRVVLTSDN